MAIFLLRKQTSNTTFRAPCQSRDVFKSGTGKKQKCRNRRRKKWVETGKLKKCLETVENKKCIETGENLSL